MQQIRVIFVTIIIGRVYCLGRSDDAYNISPRGILSKFSHRRERRELITSSQLHDNLELVDLGRKIPNPCNNGGSLLHNIKKNVYVCQCSDEYEGRHCDIKTKVCFEEERACKYYENSSIAHECRAVQGSGFVCYHHLPQYQTNWCQTNNAAERRTVCPENWTCLDHVLGDKQGYRCLPPGQIKPPKIRGRRDIGIIEKCSCHNGGECNEDQRCVCLPHFTGLYCESQVNYCHSDPCPLNKDCEPVLGGYTCNCPDYWGGNNCEETRRFATLIMVNPRFLIHANQYASVSSTCLFYVDEIGHLPKLMIDFGDGTVTTFLKNDFNPTEMLNNVLISFLYQPVKTKGVVYLVNYTHTYELEGLYNISLGAWNEEHEVTRLNFTVRVSSPETCEFSVELINAATKPDNATIYQRRHSINIYSVSVFTCPGTRLKYSWELFAVSNILTSQIPDMLARSMPHTLIRTSEYNISPYTLPFGDYELRLTVQMFKPFKSGNKSVVTWFKIVEDKIIAHISEGNIRQVHKSQPFEIDGSESYDPNFPFDTMRFEWTCLVTKPEDMVPGFCDHELNIISTEPVLSVRNNILKSNGVYMFKVSVKSIDQDRAEQSVKVEVVSEDTELVHIECVQNCLGNKVITTSPMALKAVTSNDNNSMIYSWTISHSSDDASVSADSEIEYYSDGDNFVTKPGALLSSRSYQISVKAEKQNDSVKRVGTAAIYLFTYPALRVGFCIVSPSQGYALLTKFQLKCFRFTANYLPVVYEVFQYRLPKEEPVMISFGVSGVFNDITLAAGLPENDYSTALRVYASDSKGNFGFYEQDITVFPAAVYTSLNDELAIVKKLISGAASAIVTNIANREVQSAIRIILSASCSIHTLSQQLRYTTQLRRSGGASRDFIPLDEINSIAHFKDIMVEYLAHCQLHSPIIAKYCSSTLTSILECDHNHILINEVDLSYANKKAVHVLDNIINMLHNKTQHSEDTTVIRTDVLDIGTTILSSVSLLLRKPKGDTVEMLMTRRSNQRRNQERIEKKKTLLDLAQQEKQLARQTEAVMNSMNNYASLFARYMAPHEDDYLTNPKEDICISIQKTNRGVKTATSPAYVEVNVSILSNDSEAIYNLQVITLKNNPYWWEKNADDINFPLIKVDVFTTIDESRRRMARVGASRRHEIRKSTDPVVHKADLKFLPPQTSNLVNNHIIQGSVAVKPTWSYTDSDISVHKLDLRAGGRTILVFDNQGDDVLLRVAVRKNVEPDLNDFWESKVIPKFEEINLTEREKWSIDIDSGNNTEQYVSYYVGILPHQATIRSLLGDIDPPLPNSFLYEKPPPEPNASRVHDYISYSFKAYSAQCMRWSDSKREWTNHCKVLESDLIEMTISCHCDGLSTIGASLRAANAVESPSRFSLFFKFVDNSLIFWFLIYVTVCFLGLFAWGGMRDRRDKKQEKLIVLADNKADDKYCYVILVQTGKNLDPSTSSRVAVILEGSEGNSSIHVLHSSKRRVMLKGSKDYFILCTPRSLGDVFRLHLWHNHKGSRAVWYIEKIFVHDVQTHNTSVFLFETWLTPLDAHGRMGLSCYRILNNEILLWRTRLENAIADAMDAGYHCWLGMCSSRVPWKNTRRRRVVLAYVHTCVLMASVTGFYPLPEYKIATKPSDIKKEFVFEWEEVIVGIVGSCIAFSIHCIFFGIAKNVAPSQSYTTEYSSRYVEELVIPMPGEPNTKTPTVSLDDKELLADEIQLVNFYKSGEKQVIVGRRALPLRLPRAHSQRTFYDEVVSRMGPIQAMQRIRFAYLFSHTYLYSFWILLGIVLLIALHFILFYATFYEWSIELRYLFATFVGFLFSFIVLEPLKVMIFALWKMRSQKGILVIEDRSGIALYIISNLNASQLHNNRTANIYKPPIM